MLVFMMSCEKSTSSSETWLVVNGVLVEGEFPQVMLKRPVGLESNASGEPVAGAKVMIYGPDAIITLTEIEGGNGLYSDVNGVMPIAFTAVACEDTMDNGGVGEKLKLIRAQGKNVASRIQRKAVRQQDGSIPFDA